MKRKNIPFILFGVLAVLLLGYFIFTGDDRKTYQWWENYRADNDQPYGTLFLRQMLESHKPEGKFTFNNRSSLQYLLDSDSTEDNTDYVLIGQSIHLDQNDALALSEFIQAGNSAFISTLQPPQTLLYQILAEECGNPISYETMEQDIAEANFYHDSLKIEESYDFKFRMGTEDRDYHWSALSPSVFCDSTKSLTPLGYLKSDRVNFVRIRYGEGYLYLHTNPLFFTNYFITKEDKLAYIEKVFSHLNGKNIIWDEYSKIPFLQNNNPYESPLYYILSQKSLKYAWWIFLATVVLYILFAAKRTQRVIPVLEMKTNTSLEYVNLISSLYYQNGNHLDMARKKMKYFLYFIRSKYGIHTQTFKEEHLIKLSRKSQVDVGEIRNIFSQYDLIERNFANIEANRLLDLYTSIENFYKNCK